MSSNRTVQKHTGVDDFSHISVASPRICIRFFPTLGQSSGSRRHRLLDSLSGRETRVGNRLCDSSCHAKRRWMWLCATPATWNQGGATQNDGGCDSVPRLPRETRGGCQVVPRLPRKSARGVTGAQAGPSAPPSAICPSPATQNDGGCDFVPRPATWNQGGCQVVPRLPRKVPRRHRRTKPDQARQPSAICPPRLPRKTTVDVTLCHACHVKPRWCHAKRRWMWLCATLATWNQGGCQVVPRLPRKVPRRHRRPSRTKRATQCHLSHACHAKRRWMWLCATPATWNQGGCQVVPRLPRKVPRRHRRPSRTKRATPVPICPTTCHAKRRWMWLCATPATWNQGGCQVVPTPATQSAAASQAPKPDQARPPQCHLSHACHAKTTVDVSLCHACHVKPRWMSGCATPATQSAAGVTGRPSRTKRATPVSICPTPCHAKRRVDVTLCHACHVKPRWMSGCATPATQKCRGVTGAQAGPERAIPVPWVPRLPRKTTVDASFVPRLPRETKVDVTKCHACHAKCLPRETKVDVTKCHACPRKTTTSESVKLLYVTFGYVKLLYVTFGYVKLLYVKLLYVWSLCVLM